MSLPVIPGLPFGLSALSDQIANFQQQAKKAAAVSKYVQAPTKLVQSGVQPTSIVLEIMGTSVPTTLPTPLVPRSPGSPGRAPQAAMTQSTPQPLASLNLDISLAADGLTQSVSYSFPSRQTTHQTAGGYYVDEFGLAPGTIAIDVIVLSQGDLTDQIKKFKNMLFMSKLTNPLSPSFPTTLLYVNAYDGCSYVLSQTQLDFREDAERPNTMMVSLSGVILQDYNAPPSRTNASSIASVATANQPATQASQASILQYAAVSLPTTA